MPAGWYEDTTDPTLWRWWDGQAWTGHTSPRVAPTGWASTPVPPSMTPAMTNSWPTPGVAAFTAQAISTPIVLNTPQPTGSATANVAPVATVTDLSANMVDPASTTDDISVVPESTTDRVVWSSDLETTPVTTISSQAPGRMTAIKAIARRIAALERKPAAVLAALALIVGIGTGAALNNATNASNAENATAEIASLKTDLSRVENQRDDLQEQLDDREAQRLSDEAAAARATTEQAQREADAAAAAAAAQAEAEAAAARAAAEKRTINDGVFEIGVDKEPGRYKTSGGDGCYYAVLRSPDTFDIVSNNFQESGPATVDLRAGQFFQSRDCGTWTKA